MYVRRRVTQGRPSRKLLAAQWVTMIAFMTSKTQSSTVSLGSICGVDGWDWPKTNTLSVRVWFQGSMTHVDVRPGGSVCTCIYVHVYEREGVYVHRCVCVCAQVCICVGVVSDMCQCMCVRM